MKELEIIKTIEPKIIFEAGAADGTHTVMLSQMFPNATIYAFEPVKYWYNLANDRINAHYCKNVKLYNLALRETEGIQDIYISYIKSSPIIFKTIKAIYTETNMIETYEGTELYDEYKKFMYDNNYVAISEWFSPTGDQGDTMFVNKNYKNM